MNQDDFLSEQSSSFNKVIRRQDGFVRNATGNKWRAHADFCTSNERRNIACYLKAYWQTPTANDCVHGERGKKFSHENVGTDVYSIQHKGKKKRAYNIEHSCITSVSLEKMNVSAEQLCTIRFCVRLKKTPSETIALLKEVFGKETLDDSMFWWWYKAFIDGRESEKFELWGGAPRTVVTATNINTVAAVIEEDWHLTIRVLVEALHIPHDTENEDNESVTDDEWSCFVVSFFLAVSS